MRCPLMVNQYGNPQLCGERHCALWDNQEDQCCIKTMALRKPVDPIQTIVNQSYKYPSDALERGDW